MVIGKIEPPFPRERSLLNGCLRQDEMRSARLVVRKRSLDKNPFIGHLVFQRFDMQQHRMIAGPIFVPEYFVDTEFISIGSRIGRILRFGADGRASLLHQQLIFQLMLELDQEKMPFRILGLLHLDIRSADDLHASHHQQQHHRIDSQCKRRFQ